MARINASCIACGVNLPVIEMTRSNPLDRGGKPGYICPNCLERVNSYYSTTGDKGNDKSELWTVSEELETSDHSPAGHGNLLHNGFRATHDSSLGYNGVEYKSPVYHGFGGLVKYQKSIEKMLNSGDLEIDRNCGHHLHIGRVQIENHLGGHSYEINAKSLDIAWKYRRELLIPLGNYLRENPNECKRIFGRPLGNWADHPDNAWRSSRREHDNRYCYINLCTEGKDESGYKSPEYAKTIEFRVNRFINAKQYSNVIMLEKKMTAAIISNFWDYAYTPGVSESELRKQAVKTGNKLVSLFVKACQE